MQLEVLAEGLEFPEGPIAMSDGSGHLDACLERKSRSSLPSWWWAQRRCARAGRGCLRRQQRRRRDGRAPARLVPPTRRKSIELICELAEPSAYTTLSVNSPFRPLTISSSTSRTAFGSLTTAMSAAACFIRVDPRSGNHQPMGSPSLQMAWQRTNFSPTYLAWGCAAI